MFAYFLSFSYLLCYFFVCLRSAAEAVVAMARHPRAHHRRSAGTSEARRPPPATSAGSEVFWLFVWLFSYLF